MAKSLFGRDHDGYVGRDEHTVRNFCIEEE